MPDSPSIRQAGAVQGWVLVAAAWLSVMANQVLGPVLPGMTAYFHDQPRVDLLISLTATLPSLFIALLAAPFGVLGDRAGHKRVLFGATLFYGLAGTAPLWLPTLPQIVVSRSLVGIAEAAIMTCSTTLLISHFHGAARGRYLALQTGTAPIVAVIVTLLGGALGNASWRNPFLIYGFAFLLIPLTGLLVWEPPRVTRGADAHATTVVRAGDTESFGWGRFALRCAVSGFAMLSFLVTAIQTSFLVSERGLTAPGLIGRWVAISMLVNPIGAALFAALRWRSVTRLAVSFGLMGAGFAVMAHSGTWQAAIAGAAIANLGAGMILPTIADWTLGFLPGELRGRGSGLWFSSVFLGQFLSPLAVLGLRGLTGGLSSAIAVFAMACLLAAVLAAGAALRRRPAAGAR